MICAPCPTHETGSCSPSISAFPSYVQHSQGSWENAVPDVPHRDRIGWRGGDGCSALATRLSDTLALPRTAIWAEPERDVGWLHRFPHHAYQIVAQRIQIRLIPELGREGFEGLRCIVFPSVEASI